MKPRWKPVTILLLLVLLVNPVLPVLGYTISTTSKQVLKYDMYGVTVEPGDTFYPRYQYWKLGGGSLNFNTGDSYTLGLNWYPETYSGTVYQSNTTAVALVSQATPLGQVERYAVQPPPSGVYNVTATLPDGTVLTQSNVEIAPGTTLAPHLYMLKTPTYNDYVQFRLNFESDTYSGVFGIFSVNVTDQSGSGFYAYAGAYPDYVSPFTIGYGTWGYDFWDVISANVTYAKYGASLKDTPLSFGLYHIYGEVYPNDNGSWSLSVVVNDNEETTITPTDWNGPYKAKFYIRIFAASNYGFGGIEYFILWNARSNLTQFTTKINMANEKLFFDPTFYNGTVFFDLVNSSIIGTPYGGVSRVPANSTWLWVVEGYPSPWLEFRWFPVGSNITLTDNNGHTYTYHITDQPWLHATAPGKTPPTVPSGTLQDLPVAPPDAGTYNITVRLPDGTVLKQLNAPVSGGTILAPHLYDVFVNDTASFYMFVHLKSEINLSKASVATRERWMENSTYEEKNNHPIFVSGVNSNYFGIFTGWATHVWNLRLSKGDSYYSVISYTYYDNDWHNIYGVFPGAGSKLKLIVDDHTYIDDQTISSDFGNITVEGVYFWTQDNANNRAYMVSFSALWSGISNYTFNGIVGMKPLFIVDPTWFNGTHVFDPVNGYNAYLDPSHYECLPADEKWLWVIVNATSDGLLHLDWFPVGTQVELSSGNKTYRYVVLPTSYLSESQVRSDALYAPPGTYNITVQLPEPWGWTLRQKNVELTPGTVIAPHMTAWSFDGKDDYIDVNTSVYLPFTVEVMVNYYNFPTDHYTEVLSQGSGPTNSEREFTIGHYRWTPNRYLLKIYLTSGSSVDIYSATLPEREVWYLLDYVVSHNYVKFYVDGTLDTEKTFSGTLNHVGNINIGRLANTNGEYFNGSIEYVTIYNTENIEIGGKNLYSKQLHFIMDPTWYDGKKYIVLNNNLITGTPYGGVARVWDGVQWLWVVAGARNDSLIHLDWLPAGSVVTLESPGYRKQMVVGEEDRWIPTEQGWHTDNITVTPTSFLTVSTDYGTVALPSTSSNTVSLFSGVHGLLDHIAYNDTSGTNTLFRPEFQGSSGYTDLYGKITLTISGSINKDQYENFTVETWYTSNSSVLVNYFTTGSTIQFYGVFGETKVITLGLFETVDLHPGIYDIHFEMPLTPGEKPLTRSDYYAVVYGGAVLSSTGTVSNGFISYANRNAVYTLNPPVKGCVEFYLNGTVLGGGVLTVYNESLVFTYNATSGLLSFSTVLNTANESGSWNVTVENLTLLMVDTSLNTLYLYAYNYTWIELGGWPLTGGEIASITLTGNGYFVFTRSSVVKATVPSGGVLEINGYDSLGYPLHLRVQDNGPGDYDMSDGQVTMLLLAAYPIDAVISVYTPQTEVAPIMPAVINTPMPSVTVTPAGFPSTGWSEKPNMSYYITDWDRWSAVVVVFTSAVISLIVPPTLAPFAGLIFLSGVGIGQAAGWVDLSPKVYGLAAMMIVFALLYRRQSMQVA